MIFLCQMVHVRECSVSIFKKALMFGVFPLVQVLYRSLAGNQTKDLKGLETWRSALSEIHRCLPQTLEVSFAWDKKPKGEAAFDTLFEFTFWLQKRSRTCRLEAKSSFSFSGIFLTVYVNRLARADNRKVWHWLELEEKLQTSKLF